MKRLLFLALSAVLLHSCQEERPAQLKTGDWWATMAVTDSIDLPFNFTLAQDEAGSLSMVIQNADERVVVDEIELQGDSIRIQMPVFEGYIAGTYTPERITGSFIKESLDRIVPFNASFGTRERFASTAPAAVNVSGIWETQFDFDTDDPYSAKGIFYQTGNKVTGTFRTTTGDYRYLEGVVDGEELQLSTFDGAHVFLFTATVSDSTLQGTFYSGNHSVEYFKAKRNDGFELPDASSLTFIKEGYDGFDFEFPNAEGEMVSMDHPDFKDKVVLVQIMGIWCPNCLDETRFYVDYAKQHPSEDLEFIALAFEYAKTEAKAWKGIERLKERIGVEYPVLLAQVGTSNKTKANEKLPMFNHVLSYPTTIYIDKSGAVRKIHTGFNGPATGARHEAFKKEFAETVTGLLAE